MLATMPTPIFTFSSPYRPAVPSPLSSSPIRASQTSHSSPLLSPRNPNTPPRREAQFSPTRDIKFQVSPVPAPKFKFASQNNKPNPVKQNRDNAQESRRKLFLKNVRQRRDDRQWERRGGDQEALKLEWSLLDRQWREQKDADFDGVVLDDELDDIPVQRTENQAPQQDPDEMMVDDIAQAEEAEMDAMFSMYEAQPAPQHNRPESPSLSDDDDYDSIFMDFLSQKDAKQDIVLSGQMDMS